MSEREPTWRIIVGLPKTAEGKEAFRQLKAHSFDRWFAVSLGLYAIVGWGAWRMISQGGLDPVSVAAMGGGLAAQIVPYIILSRWRKHAHRVMAERQAQHARHH
jgi:hypothetical protein